MGTKLLWILFFLVFGYNLDFGNATDPVLSWSTWTDSVGNSADENSDLTWVPIPTPANSTYKGGNINYDSRGLEPLYNFAKSFINGAVFPSGLNFDVINKLINGTLIDDVTTNYMDYVKEFAGYGALMVIGFLFIFIFPIIGLCFCCCRCCCSNCGGAMRQSPKDADNDCKRRTFAVILLVLIAFIVGGMVCVFISNDQMTDTIEAFDSSASNALDDIDTFIDILVSQIKHIGQANFNFTRDVIYRDLDSIGYIVGIPAREQLKTEGGVDTAINSALALAAKVDDIATALLDLNTTLTHVLDNATALETVATTLKNDIQSDTTACGGACSGAPDVSSLDVQVDTSSFPDLSSQLDRITSVQSQNLTKVILEAEQEFEDIPWRVVNETKKVVSDLKDIIGNFSEQLDPLIDQANSIKSDATGSFDIESYKNQIGNYTNYGVEYNKYRWYGGIGLTSVILIIVLLLLIGLMLAVCGHSSDVHPTERSCVSSCGGHMFMAAVGLVFIFSSLLMLLTTIIFLLGTPLHRFVCEPITDPDLTDLQRILDDVMYRSVYGGTGSFLGKTILQNGSHTLNLKDLLRDCEAGKSAYTAFDLSTLIDITQLTNYSSHFDVDSEINKINVSLSSIQILTPELTTQLEDLKQSADVNFTQFREQLSKDSLGINLTELAEDLRNFSASISVTAPAYSTSFSNHANTADSINTNQLPDFNTALTELGTKLDLLEAAINGTSDSVDTTLAAFNATKSYLQANGSQVITEQAKSYANRLLKIVDSFVNDTVDALENEIGACTPIWNLYNDLFIISFCKYLVDTLNGFWFGLGWCIFFFLPSIIFATKLAKHYRKMKTHEFQDSYDKGGMPLPEVNRQSSSPGFKNNKVGHTDNLSSW